MHKIVQIMSMMLVIMIIVICIIIMRFVCLSVVNQTQQYLLEKIDVKLLYREKKKKE